MECKKRIIIDIEKLEKSLEEIKDIKFTKDEKWVIKRARSYGEDCKYYLDKGDEMTSFGCITYSHGLLDTLKILHGLI